MNPKHFTTTDPRPIRVSTRKPLSGGVVRPLGAFVLRFRYRAAGIQSEGFWHDIRPLGRPHQRYASTLHAFEQINNLHSKRLSHQMQAGQCNVHSPVLERTYLRPVKPRFVRKLILRPAPLLTKGPHTCAQPLLDFLPLHQKQFRGILLKRILLIRRVSVRGGTEVTSRGGSRVLK